MSNMIDGKLDEHNIIDLVMESGGLLKTSFQSKFGEIYGMQKTMLINDLVDSESKQILLQYLQSVEVQAKFFEKLEEDEILTYYQKCLQKSKIKTDVDFQGKFHQFMKVAEKKCKNNSEPMTLKTEYEILIEEASKCFKLKALQKKKEEMNSGEECSQGTDSGSYVNDWKIKLPTIEVLTEFQCGRCCKYLRNKAGLSMHQKKCGQVKTKKVQKKSHKNGRKCLRSKSKNHQ